MTLNVNLPAPLRLYAGNKPRLRLKVAGGTVADLLVELAQKFPDLAAELLQDNGRLRLGYLLYVGDLELHELGGLEAPLQPDTDLTIVVPLAL